MRWLDVEVRSRGDTPPSLHLDGEARTRAESRGVRQTLVSLSHDGGYALAVVMATDGR